MPDHALETRGLAAWVEVGGNQLECYGSGSYRTQYAENMSCWVASEENKAFAVWFSKRSGTFACVANLYLDGKWMAKRLFKSHEQSVFSFHEKRTADRNLPYIFCSQSVVDDDALLEQNMLAAPPPGEDAEHVGEITIRVERVTDITYRHRRPPRRDNRDGGGATESGLPPIQKIHETSMKAKKPPHQISLGEGSKREPDGPRGGGPGGFGGGGEGYRGGRESMRPTFTVLETIATFTFRYRPMEILIDSKIVPQPTTNTAQPDTRANADHNRHHHHNDAEDDDDDDIYALSEDPENQNHPSTSYATPARAAHDRIRNANRELSWLNTPAREHATPTTAILQNAAILQNVHRSNVNVNISMKGAAGLEDENEYEDENQPGPSGLASRLAPMVKPEPDNDVIEIKDEEELALLARLQEIRSRKRKAPDTPLKGAVRKSSRPNGDMPPPPFFTPGAEVIDLT